MNIIETLTTLQFFCSLQMSNTCMIAYCFILSLKTWHKQKTNTHLQHCFVMSFETVQRWTVKQESWIPWNILLSAHKSLEIFTNKIHSTTFLISNYQNLHNKLKYYSLYFKIFLYWKYLCFSIFGKINVEYSTLTLYRDCRNHLKY